MPISLGEALIDEIRCVAGWLDVVAMQAESSNDDRSIVPTAIILRVIIFQVVREMISLVALREPLAQEGGRGERQSAALMLSRPVRARQWLVPRRELPRPPRQVETSVLHGSRQQSTLSSRRSLLPRPAGALLE
jgi:hypothetical protein